MHSPARKIKKSSVKNIVRFPSSKNDRTILLESILESEFALLLEYDSKIETYFEQPETFLLKDENGKTHKYTPDFLLVLTNGQNKYIEVKPESVVNSGKYSKVFDLFKQRALEIGSSFEIITETTIKKEPLLQNLKYFYKYRKNKSINITYLDELASNVSTPVAFKELIQTSNLKSLYELLAFGYLQFDIHNEIFSINSEVWLNDK